MRREILFVALVTVLALGWLKAHDAQIRYDALATLRAESLSSALDSIRQVSQRLAHADSQLAQHEMQDRARFVASSRALSAAAQRADSTAALLDSVLASLPDSAPLAIAISRERQFGIACQDALGACGALVLTLTGRRDSLLARVAKLEPALERTTQLWREAERGRKPSLLGQFRIALPFMAGAVATWELIR